MNHFLDEYYDQKQSYDRKARELSKMLTNLSHDIRTPITILKGNSEILLKQIEEDREKEMNKRCIYYVEGELKDS